MKTEVKTDKMVETGFVEDDENMKEVPKMGFFQKVGAKIDNFKNKKAVKIVGGLLLAGGIAGGAAYLHSRKNRNDDAEDYYLESGETEDETVSSDENYEEV